MIDAVFVCALVVIWAAILRMLVLTAAGSTLARRAPGPVPAPPGGWPGVSILVPARDEIEVIEESLARYLAVDYPPDRLEVVLVDDGSLDGTGSAADRVAAVDGRLKVIHVPPPVAGRGKAEALNRGLVACRHELVAVYDADDCPRPDALRRLVAGLDGHVAAVGRIVKVNRRATLLNRMSWLDFVAFQWTFQAGRSRLLDVALLPGTNYVVRADALRRLGGWDPRALAEDLELSVRLHCDGARVAFVPGAVSEEQDPERVRVWVRQRTRWLLGGLYVLRRRTGPMLRSRRPRAVLLAWELVELYSVFVLASLVSQAFLIAGLTGVYRVEVEGPLLALWALAFVAFALLLQVAAALERDEHPSTPLLAVLMYLLYAPLWLLVLLRAVALSVAGRGGRQWAKTPHTRLVLQPDEEVSRGGD